MRTKKHTTAYLFFFAAMLFAAYFHIAFSDKARAWSDDPTVNTPICTASGVESSPKIATDGSGGAIIAWEDRRTTVYPDIYTQRINASGATQWTANGVAICTASGGQYSPKITTDGSGGAIIAWEDNRVDPNADIYARRVNASGVPQWTANGVAICTASKRQYHPKITTDGSGGAIIVWNDWRSGSNSDIYARRINGSGVLQWTADGEEICTESHDQTYATITTDGSGGAIIAWLDYRGGTVSPDIYAQRVNGSGVTQWTDDGVAICMAAGWQYSIAIISDGSGGAVIAWKDDRSGNWLIYAQRVDEDGDTLWADDGVAVCTGGNGQQDPTLTTDGSGGAIITWHEYDSVTYSDVYAQRVDASGSPQWGVNGVAICTAIHGQEYPQITTDGSGGAIITWDDERDGVGTGYADIYAQRVDGSGVPQWPANGIAICTESSDQWGPTMSTDGAGGAIITWNDYRRTSSNADIYAQRIYRDGSLAHNSLPFLPLLLLE